MPIKTTRKKSPAALPAGIKRSTRKLSPALRKLLLEDRAIASGGSNLVHRKPASSTR